MQTLEERGLLGRAKWIIGVSGGSYTAASRALVARGLAKKEAHRDEDGNAGQNGDGHQGRAERPAYAPGTPEEWNLRNNTHYIAPDAKTMLVAVLSLLLGSAVTCLLVIAPLFAFSYVWGWLLHERGVLVWAHGQASASVSAWTWWLAPAAVAGITLTLFLYWWATLVSGGPRRGDRRASAVGWAATVTFGLALLMLAAPLAIAWLDHSTGALGTVVRFFGFSGPGSRSVAALTGLAAAVATIVGSLQKQLARLRVAASATGSASGGLIAKIVQLVRAKLAPWLTSLVIIAVGAFAVLLWIGNAAKVGFSGHQLVPVLVAAGTMLGTRACADINRTSLHDLYRWRLADAYAVTRDAVQARTAAHRAELFAAAARIRLSELGGHEDDPEQEGDDACGPQLVIATTANINADRAVPPGRGGFCLAFAPDKATLRGDPSCGEPNVEAETADYEALLGHTRFTLFDVVAISGAAFSPLMGAATHSAYRIVLTLTNLRLGVWMPHPDVVRRARAYLDGPAITSERDNWWVRPPFLLLLWYALWHPLWHRDEEGQQKREDRLWAHILKLRIESTKCRRRLRRTLLRLQAAVCWRVMQPTLGMLWAEAVGHTSYRATWINVTDGGHYDNLGLVEALHRGADNIVVLDATGDQPNTWYSLGDAIALARTDAGVDISLEPTTMIGDTGDGSGPKLRTGEVLRPWARGPFTRLDAAPTPPSGADAADGRSASPGEEANPPGGRPTEHGQLSTGKIWVCKLGWWAQAPWDVRAYAESHHSYPCDPTLEQLYDGAEFEAYRELGASAVSTAIKDGELSLPPLPDPATT